MTLSYQLTFEDYREANLGQATGATRKKAGRGIFGWMLFVGLAVMLFFLLNVRQGSVIPSHNPSTPPPPAAPYLQRAAAAAAPAVLIGIIIWWSSRKAAQKSLPKPWDRPPDAAAKTRTSPKGIFGWLLFVGLAVMLFMLLQNQSQRPRPAATSSPSGAAPLTSTYNGDAVEPSASLTMFDYVLGFVPLVTLLIVFVWIARRRSTRQLETTWEAQPFLQRPETVEATDQAISFNEPMSRRSYDWSYFAGFKETASLLLLYHSPYAFHIIPKRGFATPSDYDVFRGYLLSGIKHGYFLPQSSAFPVIPMAQRNLADGRA